MNQLIQGLQMEQLVDVLQLVGFLTVITAVLAVLMAVAIVLGIFLHMTNRQIVIAKNATRPHAQFWSIHRYLIMRTLD